MLVSILQKGHQREGRTKQPLRDLCSIQGWILRFVILSGFFHVCQLKDKSVKSHPAPLQPVALPDGPWQKVAVEIVRSFDTAASNCRVAIALTDYYST